MKNVDRHKMKKCKNHNHDITLVIIYDSFILNFGIYIVLLMWKSKKSSDMAIEKILNIFFKKSNVFQLLHGMKNVYGKKIYVHWRKSFLQLLVLRIFDSFLFRQSK